MNEKLDRNKEETNESLKQINTRFDRIEENNKQMKENISEKIEENNRQLKGELKQINENNFRQMNERIEHTGSPHYTVRVRCVPAKCRVKQNRV